MIINDLENLKGKFFKGQTGVSYEYFYIEDVKIHDNDDEYVVDLRIIIINNNTVDTRSRLGYYSSVRHVKINDRSVSGEYILSYYWNFNNVKKINSDRFKKELFAYFNETYYRIFNETPN